MSKDISIQENGVAQTLNMIGRVVTSGQRGGGVDWVPEDEVQLGEITIGQNGEYTASSKGVYAFSKVVVKATGKAVGINPDTGEWEVFDVDEDGFLKEHGLPVRIEVVGQPDKTWYFPLEPINTKGMVVMAYYDDYTEYGVVPREEYTIDPIVAPTVTQDEYSDGNWLNAIGLSYIGDDTRFEGYHNYHGSSDNRTPWIYTYDSPYPNKVFFTKYNGLVYVATDSATSANVIVNNGGSGGGLANKAFSSTGIPVDSSLWEGFASKIPTSYFDPTGKLSDTLSPVEGVDIAVKWNRVGDKQELTTSFKITVTQPI